MKKEKVIQFIEKVMLGFVFAYALLDMYSDRASGKRKMEREERQHQEIMDLLKKRHVSGE